MLLPAPTYWTADLVRALPDDGQRHELAHGELLVTPSPAPHHQRLHAALALELGLYLRREPVGQVWSSPADLSWGPDTLLQPDLFVVPAPLIHARAWTEIRDLLLVIEILSPSTATHDRFQKRRCYQEARVPHYWIVDGAAAVIELWTPDARFPTVERERLIWHPAGATTPFTLDLPALFAAG